MGAVLIAYCMNNFEPVVSVLLFLLIAFRISESIGDYWFGCGALMISGMITKLDPMGSN